ncbi:O-methyltransferase, putative [Talaromyces stipitatus ATCC 10500]|uniref:O-methyltransferase, putative n=2 Tax=Talaromyces stipitatus (strain ATCC 10500 / CBS 375.48 / QM 6759 / NRRL 1006) TaxID=441959 RepID=B8MG63_TALSN|nr:O-methyltransferase, putative [Talaromyces stipitatus ATCC 10500]EED15930.1 O-methyltransferase, putative [Talaromyces stipitatus ATCC 10500]
MTPPVAAVLAQTVTVTASLSFIPVAVYFNLFSTLVKIGKAATSKQITDARNEERSVDEKEQAPLCYQLTHDVLYSLSSIGLVDLVQDDVFEANDITRHMIAMPSAQHGTLHFATEPMFAGAFLMRKLIDTKFEYPFKALETPTQYGYKLLGQDDLAKEHTYSIMARQGRMDSFNQFMVGKFGKFGKMPERVKSFGYDLDSAVSGTESDVVWVDIGGGRGEMLLELKEAYPTLSKSALVLQEFNPDIGSVREVTQMEWNFASDTPQPVEGALNYSLTHIFHNLPDLDALELMQKVSKAMALYSRLIIQEFTKNKSYGKMHATMITLYGGRLRSSAEWKRLAALCGLRVTFEAYPEAGEGLIEMRKIVV